MSGVLPVPELERAKLHKNTDHCGADCVNGAH